MAQRTKTVPLTPDQLQLERDVKRLNERINEINNKYTDTINTALVEQVPQAATTHFYF